MFVMRVYHFRKSVARRVAERGKNEKHLVYTLPKRITISLPSLLDKSHKIINIFRWLVKNHKFRVRKCLIFILEFLNYPGFIL